MASSTFILAFALLVTSGESKITVEDARVRAQVHIAQRMTALALSDPAKELRERNAIQAGLSVIVRYDQLHNGVPVHGGQLIISVTRDAVSESNHLVLPLTVDTTPTVSAKRAEEIALATTKIQSPEQLKTTLMITPSQSLGDGPSGDRLAWRVEVFAQNEEDGLVYLFVYVDAHSGDVSSVVSQLCEFNSLNETDRSRLLIDAHSP